MQFCSNFVESAWLKRDARLWLVDDWLTEPIVIGSLTVCLCSVHTPVTAQTWIIFTAEFQSGGRALGGVAILFEHFLQAYSPIATFYLQLEEEDSYCEEFIHEKAKYHCRKTV